MVVRGYKKPLVQEDMWEINEVDSTPYISQHFEHHMKFELGKARVQFQKKLKKKLVQKVIQEEASQNGLSNSLGKGVSQDVLVMVRTLQYVSFLSGIPHVCS